MISIVRRTAYAAFVVTGMGLTILVVLGIVYRRRWDWLVMPTWISAISTLGLFVGAVVTAIYAQKTYASQAEELRVQRAFARRSQAALVSAWWDEQGERAGALMRNASDGPVYQVDLTVIGPGDQYGCAKMETRVLPPSEKAVFLSIDVPARGSTQVNIGGNVPRVTLCFTDAAGVRWLRDQFGRLTQLGSNLLIKTDQMRAKVFTRFNEDFLATYGVTINYKVDPDAYPQAKFIADVVGSKATDALIAPHDWIGDLVAHNLIEPTVLSADQQAAFLPWTIKALTFDNRLYGIPMTVDTVALIRNTDLVPDQPSTFEELIATAEDLRGEGRVTDLFTVRVGEDGDPFQVWPIFASGGGYLFGYTTEGGWDTTDIGLATPGSIAAFDRLRALGENGSGVLRRSVGRTEAFKLFSSGRCAFLITTSDGMLHARRASVPFAVTAVPPFRDGKPATAFSLAHGLLMAKQGENKVIAHDLFADYLTQSRIMEILSKSIVCPVAVRATASTDPGIRQYQQLCESGVPMPTSPQMEHVWRIVGRAQASVIAGAPAKETAERAAADVAACMAENPR